MNMNDKLNSINTATQASSTGCPVAQVCGSRLPCGVCLITNQKCPLTMPAYPIITWTSETLSSNHPSEETFIK